MSNGPMTAREQAVRAGMGDRDTSYLAGNLPIVNANEVGQPGAMPQYKRGKKVRK